MSSVRSALPQRVLLPLALLALLSGVLPATAIAVAPSAAPTLTSPSDGDTVTGNPVLAWTSVTGAAKYRVQVSTSPSFTSLRLQRRHGQREGDAADRSPARARSTGASPPPTAAAGSARSPTARSRRPGATRPTRPSRADGATLSFPTEPVRFTWDSLPGAKTYTLEIDDADDYIGATSFTTRTTRPTR